MTGGVVVFVATLLAGIGLATVKLSGIWLAIAVAAVAGMTVVASRLPAAAASDPSTARPPIRELRHDLRGILSPAMMMADRLLMSSEDPVARRCAETVIETIERAEQRLATAENATEG